MSTWIRLRCDGCGLATEVGPINREFVSFNGLGHGYGRWKEPDVDRAVEPSGWIWSDPYTRCTYCPDCWKGIQSGEAA